jgi:formylglycine-generating enzyme required for sulfatase activity
MRESARILVQFTLGVLAAIAASSPCQAAVMFDMIEIPGHSNITDPGTGLGRVIQGYRIADKPVSNAQYVEFLNAADPDGLNAQDLYNAAMQSDARGGISFNAGGATGAKYSVKADMGDKPVNYVNTYDSMRFTNWLNNDQGTETEIGTYTISNDGIVNNTIARNLIAGYVLPTENEWYRAAYFDPRLEADGGPIGDDNYWTYPTMSDTVPTPATADGSGNVSNSGANVLNYNSAADWNGEDGNVTTIGSTGSSSYYGLLDAGGNVWEWNETISLGIFRGLRGGSYASGDPNSLSADDSFITVPTLESPTFGFRVAYAYSTAQIPEPNTLAYLVLAGVIMQLRRRLSFEQKAQG